MLFHIVKNETGSYFIVVFLTNVQKFFCDYIIKNSRDIARNVSTRNFTPKTLSNGAVFRFVDLCI